MGDVALSVRVHKQKGMLNYDILRKSNQQRLKRINNIFIEAELAVTGLRSVLRDMQTRSVGKNKRLEISVPSSRGKDKSILRKREDVCQLIEERIASKEYVQSLVFAISLTEDYMSDVLLTVIRAYPQKLLISPKGNALKEADTFSVD